MASFVGVNLLSRLGQILVKAPANATGIMDYLRRTGRKLGQ